MCGIYGEFFNNTQLSDKASFLKSNDRNSNRGPDMQGYWTNTKNCQLGFRRLSILDVSTLGNQPMVSSKGNFIMVFNGEIYNFLELKKALINKGYQFKTTTDTEVLVNCFEYYGIDKTLELIDGMFAIGLYDLIKNNFFLIRDFAGIKPIFYSHNNKQLIFGSSYDQISKHPLNKDLNIDKKVLKTYLRMQYVPAPYGILENTFQVEPGQIIKFNAEGKAIKKYYWRLPRVHKKGLITNKEEALSLLEAALENSVKEELRSDVPLGSFLSGGIDSPLITYFAHKNKSDLKAFTIGSDSKVHDESEDAKKYASLIGCELNLTKTTAKEALEILEHSFEHLQVPFADFSMLPTYMLTKSSKEHCTVMLSGDGGDELFFGYERFHSILKNLKWTWIPNKLKYIAYGFDKIFFKNRHLNGGILFPKLGLAHQNLHARFSKERVNAIFPNLKVINSFNLEMYDYDNLNDEVEMLYAVRNAEFYGMMQKTLAKIDRMSMANSTEVRVPFLKKSFIEASLMVHPKLSYGQFKKKQILKDLLSKLLPKSPINNTKRGFSIPLGKWIKEDLKEVFKQKLFDKNFLDFFEISKINLEQLWNEHQTGKKDHKWSIFTIYSLAVWHTKLKE